MRTLALTVCALLVTACTVASRREIAVDPRLAAYIASIRAVDNHAHPMRPIQPGEPADTEYDALPLDGIPPFQLPWRLRPENPEWAAAARALYGVPASDTGKAYEQAVAEARARVLEQQGNNFPSWVLNKAGIDVMFANRVAMGPGLGPPRFRWVAFDDALMLPLDTRAEAARTPDTKPLYPRETALLHRYLAALRMTALPPTLEGYLQAVVMPTLQHQCDSGAVAVKFEAAYLRPLDFDPPDSGAARSIYARYAHGGTPTHAEYKTVQDYLFREIARRAGRLGMAVHIHVLYEFGGYYSPSGSAPHLLESVADDPSLRGTNFVMLHGGWPLVGETMSLLGKPNMYADISMMTQFIEPSELARVLRDWLSQWPEKVLFGTDAFDGGPTQGWDQSAYLAATSARKALGLALTGMMRDGEITRPRAEQLARMVLRENAISLYHLQLK